MSAASLTLRDVHAGYDGCEVLRGVNLAVEAGASVCLVGPNGSGKSTVINAVLGLCEVTSGTVEVDGRDTASVPPASRPEWGRIACVTQDSSIFPAMTVEQNLRLGGYRMKNAAQAREAAAQLLARYPALGRRRDELAHVLSGGERRLLEVLRALMMNPSLLLADEPSIGLDAHATDVVFDLFADMRNAGITIVLVEQNLRTGLGFAETGCLVVDGRIVSTAPASTLLGSAALRRAFFEGLT